MTSILFLYKYGILGGVCTQLHHRLSKLKNDDLDIHCGFMSNHGAEKLLGGLCTLHFSLNVEKLESLITDVRFDLIVVIDTEEYILKLSQIEKIPPLVIEVHTSIQRNLEYLERIPNNLDPNFMTVSNYMKEEIMKRVDVNEGDLTIIGNIIDGEIFSFSRVNFEKSVLPPIIWVGKIDDHKNWVLAMEISSSLEESGVEHELWVIGGHTASQTTAENFFSKANDLGVIERLRWFDKINHNEMADLLRNGIEKGGVGLVTSKGESFGMSILESLLVGLPMVCSDTGAIPEICDNREYMPIYSLEKSKEAVQRIKQLLGKWIEDEEFTKMVEAESKGLAKKFSSEDMGGEYWGTLRDLAK